LIRVVRNPKPLALAVSLRRTARHRTHQRNVAAHLRSMTQPRIQQRRLRAASAKRRVRARPGEDRDAVVDT
jgi:hypothetical protein